MRCHPLSYGLGLSASFASAAAARHALVLDDLAIKVVLGLDNAAKKHPAVHAGVGVILILSGWVRVGCARLIHVNSSDLLAGLRGVPSTCGAISITTTV
jgi:hypothetical protein